jgi:hypothetical protein
MTDSIAIADSRKWVTEHDSDAKAQARREGRR